MKAAPVRTRRRSSCGRTSAAEGALKIAGFETAKSSRDLIKDKDVAQTLETSVRLRLTPEHAAAEITKVASQCTEPNNARLRMRSPSSTSSAATSECAQDVRGPLALDPRNLTPGRASAT